jgi:ribosomal protein L18E
MPMIDVDAAAGTFASKHDPARQLAAAVTRRGQVPLSRIVHYAKKGDQ